MQPEVPQTASPQFEQAPLAPPSAYEHVPTLPSVETAPLAGGERVEQVAEARATAQDASQLARGVQGVVPSLPVSNDTSSSAGILVPAVAADDDVIEGEWVAKAKEIIERTKDDPRARTDQVNMLQREYLQKRYGKQVGAA